MDPKTGLKKKVVTAQMKKMRPHGLQTPSDCAYVMACLRASSSPLVLDLADVKASPSMVDHLHERLKAYPAAAKALRGLVNIPEEQGRAWVRLFTGIAAERILDEATT